MAARVIKPDDLAVRGRPSAVGARGGARGRPGEWRGQGRTKVGRGRSSSEMNTRAIPAAMPMPTCQRGRVHRGSGKRSIIFMRALGSSSLILRFAAWNTKPSGTRTSMMQAQTSPTSECSPKAARNAFECEVRLPDGARVGPGGVRVMARRPWLDGAAYGQLDRLGRLGAEVWFEGL